MLLFPLVSAGEKKNLFTSSLDLHLRQKLVKCYIWTETRTLRKENQKYLQSFEKWCWRSLKDRLRNEEVLHRVKKDRNILHALKRRKTNFIGHILRRNCLLKHVVEGKIGGGIKVTERQGRRRKQLCYNLKETTGCWNWKRKHYIAICGELTLQEVSDLS